MIRKISFVIWLLCITNATIALQNDLLIKSLERYINKLNNLPTYYVQKVDTSVLDHLIFQVKELLSQKLPSAEQISIIHFVAARLFEEQHLRNGSARSRLACHSHTELIKILAASSNGQMILHQIACENPILEATLYD